MGSILEEYMKQFEADKQNENHEVVSNNDDELVKQFVSDFSKDEYAKKLDELRNDPNDMANKFHREYPTISDKQMDEQGLLSSEKIDAYLIHAYCPKCGKELRCSHKLYCNPYTRQTIAKHECSCGFKANLQYAYPRLVYVDKDNKQIEIQYDR